MRILDLDGNELDAIDESLGYLVTDSIVIKHHEAVEAVEEEWHYEVAKEYPNGGKDLKKVIDIPKVEAADAYDEYETVQRFIPYTQKELNELEILDLKRKLFSTDYKILKMMEGALTLEECGPVIEQRQMWRARINELEESEDING